MPFSPFNLLLRRHVYAICMCLRGFGLDLRIRNEEGRVVVRLHPALWYLPPSLRYLWTNLTTYHSTVLGACIVPPPYENNSQLPCPLLLLFPFFFFVRARKPPKIYATPKFGVSANLLFASLPYSYPLICSFLGVNLAIFML